MPKGEPLLAGQDPNRGQAGIGIYHEADGSAFNPCRNDCLPGMDQSAIGDDGGRYHTSPERRAKIHADRFERSRDQRLASAFWTRPTFATDSAHRGSLGGWLRGGAAAYASATIPNVELARGVGLGANDRRVLCCEFCQLV